MLIFILILLFIIDVKGYPQSTELINNQHQQVIFNRISPWILLRAKRNFNDTRAAHEQNIDDYYFKKKAVIDRFYTRQREINDAFQNNSSVSRQTITTEQTPTTPPGYRNLGNCSHSQKTRLLYQHNLGIGLKGSSQLNANFQVNLDSPIVITCVEAFLYNNTQGTITWLSGGPGRNYLRLNIKSSTNKGVSYVIKIYGA
ncbi:uncharacterized protein [Chelonus insularis]|uniref:uncharacterized protein n=1 Tax=Chelonus insularis TaxID=460826 RepID=UPI00158C3A2D|nr:uncharacterized protein LOC118064769 [Chelonus insularis]